MAATTMFGPLDVLLYEYAEWALLGLVFLNGVTRFVAHSRHVRQYRDGGDEAVSRFLPHVAANALLLLGAFYYATVSYVPGVLVSVLVIGVVLADVFEFEARLVEARKDESLDRPKGALAAWSVAAFYVTYRALFFVVEPLWDVVFA